MDTTALTLVNDILLGFGNSNNARLSWDTTDANANALLLQMPAGGATDVPVLVIGQSVENVDLGLYNGVVDPIVALFGVGAVATSTRIEFRKARGTVTDAKLAGLFDRKDTPWHTNPKSMLEWRARHRAVRLGFSDFLNGIGIVVVKRRCPRSPVP